MKTNHLLVLKSAPYLFGLAGCFLPFQYFHLNNLTYSSSLIGNYSGWSTIIILFIFFVLNLIGQIKKKQIHPFSVTILGLYLLGLVLFKTYHIFNLFGHLDPNSMAFQMQSGTTAGAGLYLLLISAIWILYTGLVPKNN